jgi:hypothetical protein
MLCSAVADVGVTEIDMSMALLDFGVNGTSGLSIVQVITLAGDAVHPRCLRC